MESYSPAKIGMNIKSKPQKGNIVCKRQPRKRRKSKISVRLIKRQANLESIGLADYFATAITIYHTGT